METVDPDRSLLLDAVRRRADPDGFVPFDRYMETVLYAPRVGYYQRHESPFGRSGDFYTAAHVHRLFGRCLAARGVEVHAERPRTGPFLWVDVGPGDGTLAEAAVQALGEWDAQGAWELVLVERALPRAEAAADRATSAGRAAGIPVRTVPAVADLGPFAGVVVANELLDALPVRRLRRTRAGWTELGVRVSEGGVAAAEREVASPPSEHEGLSGVENGSVVELSSARASLVREIADHLTDGAAIFLDFGGERVELQRAHPRGSLATVRGHRSTADPLDDPGRSDLSAFVDFTEVREAARRSGLREVAFRSQTDALVAWGFERLLQEEAALSSDAEARVRTNLAAKSLLFGFGAFRALELAPPAD